MAALEGGPRFVKTLGNFSPNSLRAFGDFSEGR
jgi:hypothetical protein